MFTYKDQDGNLERNPRDCVLCDLGCSWLPYCVGFWPLNAEIAVVGVKPSNRSVNAARGCFSIYRLAIGEFEGSEYKGKLIGASWAFFGAC